jgi:hypothetical protein
MSNCLRFPNVVIDAGNAEPGVLEVPWFHPQSSFNLTTNLPGQADLGVLFVFPITPLRAPGGAATAVDFTIYMQLIDTEFHVPINPALTYITPTLTETRTRQLIAQLRATGYAINEAHGLFDGAGNLFSKAKEAIGKGGNAIGKLFEGDFGGALDDLGEAVEAGLTAAEQGAELGLEIGMFDRPYDPKYERAKAPTSGSFAFGIGPDSSHRLDISCFSQYHPNSHVTGRSATDDCNILKQMQRDTINIILQWRTDQPAGDLRYQRAIFPTHLSSDGTGSWLSQFSDPFLYWRGTINVSISVVATHFHAGRLLVVFTNGYNGTPPSMDECINWPNVTIDLHNTDAREYELELPFNNTVPYLYNSFLSEIQSSVGLTPKQSAGWLLVFVQNELEAPETVASSIDVIVKVRAGNDFGVWTVRSPSAISTFAPIRAVPSAFAKPMHVTNTVVTSDDFVNVAHAGTIEDDVHVFADRLRTEMAEIKLKVENIERELILLQERWRDHGSKEKVAGLMQNIQNNLIKGASSASQVMLYAMYVHEALERKEEVKNEAHAGDNESYGRYVREALNQAHAGAVENVDEHGDSENPRMQKGRSEVCLAVNHSLMTQTDDVRDIVRRFTKLTTVVIAPPNPQSGVIILLSVQPSGPADNLMDYFSRCYAGWSGGIRYRLVFNMTNMENYLVTVMHRPDVYPLSQDLQLAPGFVETGGYAYYVTNLIDEKTISVEVPYAQPLHFLLSSNEYIQDLPKAMKVNGCLMIGISNRRATATSATGTIITAHDAYTPLNEISMDVYMAGADDFQFHLPMPHYKGTVNEADTVQYVNNAELPNLFTG